MPEEDFGASKLDHAEKVVDLMLPADDGSSGVVEPRKEAFDLPAASPAAQGAAVLGGWPAPPPAVRGDHLDAVALAEQGVERVAVVPAVADQSLREVREEAPLEGGGDEVWLIR